MNANGTWPNAFINSFWYNHMTSFWEGMRRHVHANRDWAQHTWWMPVHADVNRETENIKKGCERDIRLVDDRLRVMEKKMWTIFGALTVISFLVSSPGQGLLNTMSNNSDELTKTDHSAIIGGVSPSIRELS